MKRKMMKRKKTMTMKKTVSWTMTCNMDANLALEFVRVTEAAAIAAARFIGKGEAKMADGVAVDEMRDRFSYVDIDGVIVIGEGAKDEAPELFVGEHVGTGNGPALDIAVDPLECTDSVANGRPNAISVIASGPRGSLFQAPDMYMHKIACGPRAKGAINLDASTKDNISAVAERLGKDIADMTILVMDRPRHDALIAEIREAGARVMLITDGDVAGAICCSLDESPVDMLMGIGASAEGVLAAVAIKCLGGDLQCRLAPKDDAQRTLLVDAGIDPDKLLLLDDLASGTDLTFTATGILDGPLLQGIRTGADTITTHSVVMRVKTGTVRYLTTRHRKK
jgi:fructose-1,6-bisphosphatase II